MKHVWNALRDALPPTLLLLGAGAIAAGAALIALPAGLIVLGAELLSISVLMIRGDERG